MLYNLVVISLNGYNENIAVVQKANRRLFPQKRKRNCKREVTNNQEVRTYCTRFMNGSRTDEADFYSFMQGCGVGVGVGVGVGRSR